MIRTILQDLGFPEDPDSLKIAVFVKKTPPQEEGLPKQVSIRTVPDSGDGGAHFVFGQLSQATVDALTDNVEYGLHFREVTDGVRANLAKVDELLR